jgi:hypothetical protein
VVDRLAAAWSDVRFRGQHGRGRAAQARALVQQGTSLVAHPTAFLLTRPHAPSDAELRDADEADAEAARMQGAKRERAHARSARAGGGSGSGTGDGSGGAPASYGADAGPPLQPLPPGAPGAPPVLDWWAGSAGVATHDALLLASVGGACEQRVYRPVVDAALYACMDALEWWGPDAADAARQVTLEAGKPFFSTSDWALPGGGAGGGAQEELESEEEEEQEAEEGGRGAGGAGEDEGGYDEAA